MSGFHQWQKFLFFFLPYHHMICEKLIQDSDNIEGQDRKSNNYTFIGTNYHFSIRLILKLSILSWCIFQLQIDYSMENTKTNFLEVSLVIDVYDIFWVNPALVSISNQHRNGAIGNLLEQMSVIKLWQHHKNKVKWCRRMMNFSTIFRYHLFNFDSYTRDFFELFNEIATFAL